MSKVCSVGMGGQVRLTEAVLAEVVAKTPWGIAVLDEDDRVIERPSSHTNTTVSRHQPPKSVLTGNVAQPLPLLTGASFTR